MSNMLFSNSVLFRECIEEFRPQLASKDKKYSSKTHIVTSFEIAEIWECGYFKIYPSEEYQLLNGPFKSFISMVETPSTISADNAFKFGIALSSILSFITLTPSIGISNPLLILKESLSDMHKEWLAMHLFATPYGAGGDRIYYRSEQIEFFKKELVKLVAFLNSIKHREYVEMMQCIRLLQLSLLNKKNDFGLAYMLAVASIEAIAQKVISANSFRDSHQNLSDWENKAEGDNEFLELLDSYKVLAKKQKHLSERYCNFIYSYVPMDNWEEYLRRSFPAKSYNRRELLTSEVHRDELKKMVKDSYNYRSKFVHLGEHPRHDNADDMEFYQLYYIGENEPRFKKLINYRLLLCFAKYGVMNWSENKHPDFKN